MSKPYDFSPGRNLSEPELAERMLRVNWNTSVKRTDAGVNVLSAEFVAEQGRAIQLVDVREREELTGALGHIPGAVWIPLADIERVAREVVDDTMVVVVCDDGARSVECARRLQALGMDWVAALEGGLRAWKDRGFVTTREESVATRTHLEAPSVPIAQKRSKPLSLEEIREHIGDPRTVRWVKAAAFLLHGKTSCVDGRDDHGVVGTPGGDMGEFILTLAAVEQLTGREVPEAALGGVLQKWVEAFGHFYFHSDVGALNRYIGKMRADPRIPEALLPLRTDPPQAWRRFSAGPPEQIRPWVLEHWVNPDSTGCGHVRFMMTKPAEYGLRSALAFAAVRAFVTARWNGLVELEFVPLGGAHHEGAVVNVHLDEDVQPYTLVPLISPQVQGMQMFVNHPGVTAYQRSLAARFVCTHLGLGPTGADAERLFAAMQQLGARQAGATLGALASGLPVYDVRFTKEREFRVEAGAPIP